MSEHIKHAETAYSPWACSQAEQAQQQSQGDNCCLYRVAKLIHPNVQMVFHHMYLVNSGTNHCETKGEISLNFSKSDRRYRYAENVGFQYLTLPLDDYYVLMITHVDLCAKQILMSSNYEFFLHKTKYDIECCLEIDLPEIRSSSKYIHEMSCSDQNIKCQQNLKISIPRFQLQLISDNVAKKYFKPENLVVVIYDPKRCITIFCGWYTKYHVF